ncbi:unnamed protein product [Cuscuta europaea]|uniref:RING-type domain-containing protein n=1 Tax=Cuscuta europaea TaxID=41803 RepID=A0A9P0YUP9_CUSEU|nr:unnamed protein product [Cuscuta europaea]
MSTGGGASVSWKLKKVAKKLLVQTCGSFSRRDHDSAVLDTTATANASCPLSIFRSPPPQAILDSPINAEPSSNSSQVKPSRLAYQSDSTSSKQNVCAICLDPLNYGSSSSPGQAIFTAQCSHAFHFDCISSNVRHGSVSCPICRSLWTQLPRNLHARCSLHRSQGDPILQILDDSIATFRVHRRSFLRSARYDDDDPVEPVLSTNPHRLQFSLIPVPLIHPSYSQCSNHSIRWNHVMCNPLSAKRAYLSVKIAYHHATDMVLVASPNGPHLRLMKQAMALVVFSLGPMDRLAIVTYSSAAARIFSLRRMTSCGKRAALQVIDRLFYVGPHADPTEGLRKGVKILGDRSHQNPHSLMLHLSDSPIRSYHPLATDVPLTFHKFHVGFGFRSSNGFIMHELEGFLASILGGAVREVQLRIGVDSRIVRLGEIRAGEERRVPLVLGETGKVHVEYSYEDSMLGGSAETGVIVVGIHDKRESTVGTIDSVQTIMGRTGGVGNWQYHDPFMARRWAKHLLGYRG